jgi:DNA-binding LacI/PurR family transcriptional regulator
MNMNKRATIKEVARSAGVSTQTVSRVINDRPDVSPETRERIHQVIAELNFQPSALARSLVQQRSYTLGIVTAGLKYLGPSRTLNGITSMVGQLKYSLLLEAQPHFDMEDIRPLLQNLLSHHVDGIVWAVPEIGENRRWVDVILQDLPVPVVFLTMQARPGVTTISVDNYAGGVLATRHLLEQGCRHIGHISGPLEWWEARQRRQAWQETSHEAGKMVKDCHWQEGNWSSSSGEVAFEQLLESYPQMDAVFAANDQMALAVIHVAMRRGIRVPEDLAVVGYDNFAESAYFWPSLTTINYDHYELGCRAVQEVVKQIEAVHRKEQVEPQTILLLPDLVLRNSSVRNKA